MRKCWVASSAVWNHEKPTSAIYLLRAWQARDNRIAAPRGTMAEGPRGTRELPCRIGALHHSARTNTILIKYVAFNMAGLV